MHYRFWLFLGLFYSQWAYCQPTAKDLPAINKRVAQLLTQPKTQARDTTLANTLVEKAQAYTQNISVDSAIAIYKQALQIAEQAQWPAGAFSINYLLVETYQVKSEYFSTIKQALTLLQKLDQKKYPVIYSNTLRLIAASYLWLERPQEAKDYYDKVSNPLYFKNLKDFAKIDISVEQGYLYTKFLPDLPKAYSLLSNALQQYQQRKDSVGIGYCLSYLAQTYAKMGKSKQAEAAFESSIDLYKKQNAEYLLADGYLYAADFYEKQNQNAKAELYAKLGLDIANKINILYSKRGASRILYNVYKKQGKSTEALMYYEKYSNARDSMAQATIDDRLKVVRYEYDTQQQRLEIALKDRQNKNKTLLNIALIIGLIILGLLGFLGYRNIQKGKQIAEKELQQLQQQQQLLATKSLLQGQEVERSRLAKDLHDGLGGLLSGIKFSLNAMTGNLIITEQNSRLFEKAIHQLDTAIIEMRRVAHSMMPEALLKFGLVDALKDYTSNITDTGQLQVHFQTFGMDHRIDQSLEVSIYRIVQELINNTMKHAEATTANVQLVKDEGQLSLSVEDNGKGFDSAALQTNKGAGLQNVYSRVASHNGHITVHSDKNGSSFEIIFENLKDAKS